MAQQRHVLLRLDEEGDLCTVSSDDDRSIGQDDTVVTNSSSDTAAVAGWSAGRIDAGLTTGLLCSAWLPPTRQRQTAAATRLLGAAAAVHVADIEALDWMSAQSSCHLVTSSGTGASADS